MMTKYMVVIMDTFPAANSRGHIMETPRRSFGLTLSQARRISERAVRRGMLLYGGKIGNDPWGANTSGDNPRAMLDRPVRYATIYMDPERKPQRNALREHQNKIAESRRN